MNHATVPLTGSDHFQATHRPRAGAFARAALLAARLALMTTLGTLAAAAALSLLATGPIPEPPVLALPDSPSGKCAGAYFAMMEGGSADAVKKFEAAWASKARLARTPMDERISRTAELRTQWGRLTPERVTDSTEGSLTLQVRSENAGVMQFEFQFDVADKARLDAIMISSGPGVADSKPVTGAARAEIVAGAAKALREGYVYPEMGERMASGIEAKLESGAYDSVTSEMALARVLTDDLRAVSDDKHLGVGLAPSDGPRSHGMPTGDDARRNNYAFRKVEILPGNIGYLKFDLFMEEEGAKSAGAAALAFLANCDALIFDLRGNGGGSPEMIRFLTSYLFDSATHLNDMVDRNGNVVEEYWTVTEVPGTHFAQDLPVYVLTSNRTFSGAEEFSYNLKNLKRATIIGETTGGGAHPVRGERINDRFMIRVPFMRAQNPISKTNWEGKGVEPDVKTTAAEALDKAQELAKQAIEKRAPKP